MIRGCSVLRERTVCLGLTTSGQPKHPARLPFDTLYETFDP